MVINPNYMYYYSIAKTFHQANHKLVMIMALTDLRQTTQYMMQSTEILPSTGRQWE